MLNNLKEVAIALGKNKKLYAFGIVIMERCLKRKPASQGHS